MEIQPWLISCIVLDIGVIGTNVGQQLIISSKWKDLDRIDHLLLSLSITDLLSGITTLTDDIYVLVDVMTVPNNSSRQCYKNNTQPYCILVKFMDSIILFSIFSALCHALAIAVERIYAIRFPFQYRSFSSNSVRCCTFLAIWTSSAVLTTVFYVALTFIRIPSAPWNLDRKIGAYLRGSVLVLLISIILTLYLFIIYFLFHQRSKIRQDFIPASQLRNRLIRQTLLCVFIGLTLVICLAPRTFAYLNPNLYHPVSNILLSLNSMCNSCVYYFKWWYDRKDVASKTKIVLLDCPASLTNSKDREDYSCPPSTTL